MKTIVIAGAGAAGLSFAYFLKRAENPGPFRCILIDTDTKRANDRTWCFWGSPFVFDGLVSHHWDTLALTDTAETVTCDAGGYRMIPADRFYEAVLTEIETDPRFSLFHGRVTEFHRRGNQVTVTASALPNGPRRGGQADIWRPVGAVPGGETAITADLVVDSVLGALPAADVETGGCAQTFVGWEIESETPFWDPRHATLMDFRDYTGIDTFAFTYVLPLSPYRALVEHTVVTGDAPPDAMIESRVEEWLERYIGDDRYRIVRREKGRIPLFLHRKPRADGPILRLGVVAGAARPSTGYAFRSIVETSCAAAESVVKSWGDGGGQRKKGRFHDRVPDPAPSSGSVARVRHAYRRPRFFDTVFLSLLETEPEEVSSALVMLFRNNPSLRVLRFLDGTSSLRDDLRIVFSLPWPPFLRALVATVVRKASGTWVRRGNLQEEQI